MAILAVLLQLADRPEPSKETAMELAREYRPDTVYAGASVLNDVVVYAGGVTWQTGKRYGLGAEYRYTDEAVSLRGAGHTLETHTAGLYLYRDIPAFGDLSIRTDLGAGIVFGDSDTLAVDETWAVSARAVGVFRVSADIDLMMYFGGVLMGATVVSDDRTRVYLDDYAYPETGLALSMTF